MNISSTKIPLRGWPVSRWIGRTLLKLLGWRFCGPLPDLSKAVLTVAPHTSNWDFIIGMATAMALDLDANWLGKHNLFNGPMAGLLYKLGGIPVNRSKPAGVLEQIVEHCHQKKGFLLGLSPESTRKPVNLWKTGCCRIAHQAKIPLIPIALDYRSKTVQVLQHWTPGSDTEKDMHRLSNCFSAEMAKFPEKFRNHQPTSKEPTDPE